MVAWTVSDVCARACKQLRARARANSRSWCEAVQAWECGGVQEAVRTTKLPENESEEVANERAIVDFFVGVRVFDAEHRCSLQEASLRSRTLHVNDASSRHLRFRFRGWSCDPQQHSVSVASPKITDTVQYRRARVPVRAPPRVRAPNRDGRRQLASLRRRSHMGADAPGRIHPRDTHAITSRG